MRAGVTLLALFALFALASGAVSHRVASASSASLRARASALLKVVWPHRQRDSLMSWRARTDSFSPAHKDLLVDATGKTAVSPATLATWRRFMLDGVDTADVDVDHARFAELSRLSHHLSAETRAEFHAQLQAQHKRRAWARTRRAAMKAISVAHCNVVKTAVALFRTNNAKFPAESDSDAVFALLAGADKPNKADCKTLQLIVMYRAAHVGWAGACTDLAALTTDAAAVNILTAPPSPLITEFYMGIEEELTRTEVAPDPHYHTYAESAKGAEPRKVPHVKVVADHSDGRAIIEVATGPLPATKAGRLEHRLVVDTWDSKLNAWVNPKSNAQTEKKVADVDTEFNTACDGKAGKPPTKYALTVRAEGQHKIKRTLGSGAKTYNNIQVNFEGSLCSYYTYQKFLDLTNKQAAKDVDLAAFYAAQAYVEGGLPGVSADEISKLPSQQACELKGAFLLFISHSLFNEITDRYEENKKERTAVREQRELLRESNKLLAKDKRVKLPALPPLFGKPWGGTSKNFFNVMVKSPLHSIIPLLPFPLSDVVHRYHAAYTALSKVDAAAEDKKLHDIVIAKLKASGGVDSWAKQFAGNTPKGEPYISTQKNYRWLRYYRGAFSNYVTAGITKDESNEDYPCTPPIDCDRAPFAELYNDAGKMQIALICEARFQYDPLNRAMNDDATDQDITAQLKHLADAQSFYKAGGGTTVAPAWPIV